MTRQHTAKASTTTHICHVMFNDMFIQSDECLIGWGTNMLKYKRSPCIFGALVTFMPHPCGAEWIPCHKLMTRRLSWAGKTIILLHSMLILWSISESVCPVSSAVVAIVNPPLLLLSAFAFSANNVSLNRTLSVCSHSQTEWPTKLWNNFVPMGNKKLQAERNCLPAALMLNLFRLLQPSITFLHRTRRLLSGWLVWFASVSWLLGFSEPNNLPNGTNFCRRCDKTVNVKSQRSVSWSARHDTDNLPLKKHKRSGKPLIRFPVRKLSVGGKKHCSLCGSTISSAENARRKTLSNGVP